MIFDSKQLEDAAKRIRDNDWPSGVIAVENIEVSAAQLETAARILKGAEPSICNRNVSERPGFIERDQQEQPSVLVFEMGILPSATYRIDREGEILDD